LFLGLLGCAGLAQAQWSWRDANGGITFSDVPPPPDVKPENILQRPSPNAPRLPASAPAPGASDNRPAPAEGAAGADKSSAKSSGPKTLAEQDADFRKRRDDRVKAEQKQAEDDAKAAQKLAACNQAKDYLDMLQSNMRLMRPNPDGTRGYMEDNQRGDEVAKAQETISQNCE
jgi:hypothetical protein